MDSFASFLRTFVNLPSGDNTLHNLAKRIYNDKVKFNYRSEPLSHKFSDACRELPSYFVLPTSESDIMNLMYSLGFSDQRNDQSSIEKYWSMVGETLKDCHDNTP